MRHIRYPFYQQVVQLDVLDRVFEALLRAGGNLIIPASFVDVMNAPEARLVQRAAQRGLYVSQHHIEPLGVSHFGFENYWQAKGQEFPFAYGSHPERVREVWRAFARRWRELAGDRVVWQLGLRGKGDRAIGRDVLTPQAAERRRQLTAAIASLDALAADYPAAELSANQRAFHDIHFLTQARMLRELYAFYLALIQAADEPSQLAEAEAALQRFLAVRENAASGKWAGWYRGDKKVNVPELLERTRAARRLAAGPLGP